MPTHYRQRTSVDQKLAITEIFTTNLCRTEKEFPCCSRNAVHHSNTNYDCDTYSMLVSKSPTLATETMFNIASAD